MIIFWNVGTLWIPRSAISRFPFHSYHLFLPSPPTTTHETQPPCLSVVSFRAETCWSNQQPALCCMFIAIIAIPWKCMKMFLVCCSLPQSWTFSAIELLVGVVDASPDSLMVVTWTRWEVVPRCVRPETVGLPKPWPAEVVVWDRFNRGSGSIRFVEAYECMSNCEVFSHDLWQQQSNTQKLNKHLVGAVQRTRDVVYKSRFGMWLTDLSFQSNVNIHNTYTYILSHRILEEDL